jgi:hypothetical protein
MGCQVPWAFADRPHRYGRRESGVHVAGGEGGLLTDHDTTETCSWAEERRACAPNPESWLSASTTTSKRVPANARWQATVRHEQSGPQGAGGARWPSFIWPRRKFIFGMFAHPHARQGQADNASRRVCGLVTWARGVVWCGVPRNARRAKQKRRRRVRPGTALGPS